MQRGKVLASLCVCRVTFYVCAFIKLDKKTKCKGSLITDISIVAGAGSIRSRHC